MIRDGGVGPCTTSTEMTAEQIVSSAVDAAGQAGGIAEVSAIAAKGPGEMWGYGYVKTDGAMLRVHRVAWGIVSRPHSGRATRAAPLRRPCVRQPRPSIPRHATGQYERHMVSKGRHSETVRTTCNYGHALDGTRKLGDRAGERYCLTCSRDRQRRQKQLVRNARVARG